MNKKILLAFFLLSSFLTKAQNLVPNPSFEIFDTCPNDVNGTLINYAIDWINPTGYSPDYFNACDTSAMSFYSTPHNYYGFEAPHSGQAYAGIITAGMGGNTREYIQSALTDSLQSGTTYYIEFFVSAADSIPYAANNIGAYFSRIPIANVSSIEYLPYIPQISNNEQTNPLNSRIGWIKISGIFLPSGGEKYITIGNFNNDSNTDTTYFIDGSVSHSYSYHYIDDVSVSIISGIKNELSEEANWIVYPNPSSDIFFVDFTGNKIRMIQVYNSMGVIVFFSNISETKNDISKVPIDLSQFPNGLYLINLTSDAMITTKKIFLKNKTK